REVRLQIGPRRVPDDEEMVDMPWILMWRHVDRAARQPLSVSRRQRAPAVGPGAQPRQPRAQNRRLQLVQPRIDPRFLMMVPVGLSAVSQPLQTAGERAI